MRAHVKILSICICNYAIIYEEEEITEAAIIKTFINYLSIPRQSRLTQFEAASIYSRTSADLLMRFAIPLGTR